MNLRTEKCSESERKVEEEGEMVLGKIFKTEPDKFTYHTEKTPPEEIEHHQADNFEAAESSLYRLIRKEYRDIYP